MSQMVSNAPTTSRPRLNKYGYNCVAKHVSLAAFISAPLFIFAGSLSWDWAWIYSSITMIGWVALSLVLMRANPELLNQRGRRAKDMPGTKRWDWIIMSVYSVLMIATPVIAGLDQRYAWSVPTSDIFKLIGALVLGFSFIPLTWSMAVNRFFEPTVRIQTSREHRVYTDGPYRFVRHPGYVGVILQFIAIPLILGTLVAWIPALLGAVLFVLRTWMEDNTLRAELPGYADFTGQTRYRLVPGLW